MLRHKVMYPWPEHETYQYKPMLLSLNRVIGSNYVIAVYSEVQCTLHYVS